MGGFLFQWEILFCWYVIQVNVAHVIIRFVSVLLNFGTDCWLVVFFDGTLSKIKQARLLFYYSRQLFSYGLIEIPCNTTVKKSKVVLLPSCSA